MRTAIFHDWIDPMGGAERVVIELARAIKADIITLNLNQETIKNLECQDINFINLGSTIKIPPLKQLQASYLFSRADFSEKYDFFIFSGCWAVFAAKNHKPNLYYCHAPVRVFYDLYQEYKKQLSSWKRPFYMIYIPIHKSWYENSIKHADKIITNSKNTQKRVRKYLNRESIVINPPTNTNRFKYKPHKNFWFSVNRIYPHKRDEMQVEAFQKILDEKLIVVGGIVKGEGVEKYQKNLIKNAAKNIQFRGKISDKELREIYSECKGFITTSLDEDFGITPVEAMASGKPVIATDEGGYKETIINNKTGILIKDINPDKIARAIFTINKNPDKYKTACQNRAKKFDTRIFIRKIKKEIKNENSNFS